MAIMTRMKAVAGAIAAVMLLTGAATSATTPISPQAKQALVDTMTSELKALAFYQAVVKKLGDVRPFSVWITTGPDWIAEQLKPLFSKYGVTVPAAPDASKVQAPATFKDACRTAGQLEGERVALYDKFLKSLKETDILAAFAEMRDGAGRRLNGLQNFCQ